MGSPAPALSTQTQLKCHRGHSKCHEQARKKHRARQAQRGLGRSGRAPEEDRRSHKRSETSAGEEQKERHFGAGVVRSGELQVFCLKQSADGRLQVVTALGEANASVPVPKGLRSAMVRGRRRDLTLEELGRQN